MREAGGHARVGGEKPRLASHRRQRRACRRALETLVLVCF